MLQTALPYLIFGYLSGSVLYARIFSRLFHQRDVTKDSSDGNPGTVNAFLYGGFWCGVLTLCGDVAKGAAPVYLYLHRSAIAGHEPALILVMAAPVLGHLFPLFFGFRGGKGIAVSFGCLAGLFPVLAPLCVLASVFVFFSLVCKITPNYYRTLVTYVIAPVGVWFLTDDRIAAMGFVLISVLIVLKLLRSPEDKGTPQMEVLWKR